MSGGRDAISRFSRCVGCNDAFHQRGIVRFRFNPDAEAIAFIVLPVHLPCAGRGILCYLILDSRAGNGGLPRIGDKHIRDLLTVPIEQYDVGRAAAPYKL
jgi:hypothetical protein